jgi:hypothetical protein
MTRTKFVLTSVRATLARTFRKTFLIAFVVALMPCIGSVRAAVVYDENVSGDAPAGSSSINLGVLATGSSEIIGGNLQFDTDDYTFTIGSGSQLDSILVNSYTATGSAAIQTPFLGLSLLSSASVGQDFLDLASISQPIGSGTYMFRATTGSGGPTTYEFDFQVSSVPEPTSLGLLAIGAMTLLTRKRK